MMHCDASGQLLIAYNHSNYVIGCKLCHRFRVLGSFGYACSLLP